MSQSRNAADLSPKISSRFPTGTCAQKPPVGRPEQSRIKRDPRQHLDRALAFEPVSVVHVDGNRRENDPHRAAGRVLKAALGEVLLWQIKLCDSIPRSGFAFELGNALQSTDRPRPDGVRVGVRSRSAGVSHRNVALPVLFVPVK